MKRLLSRKWQRENGVALLMTLAILAMLMILAMSFAFTSTSEKQAAAIHSDLVRARLLTESALYRAISVIRDDLGSAYPATVGFYRVESGDNVDRYIIGSVDPSDTDVDSTVAQSLVTTLGGDTFFYDYTQGITAANDNLFAEKMEWQNIHNGSTSDSIIGRFAYMVIDESGKLPINAYIEPGTTEQSEPRLGRSDTEVFIGDALTTASTIGPFGSSVPANVNRWLSWSNLLRSNLTALDDHQKRQEAYLSLLPHGYDIEAFNDAGTDYHRFNLGLGETDFWGDAGVDSLLDANKPFWNGDEVASDSIVGLHWLSSNLSDPAVATQIRQVAANIIDYSDQDSIATTDYDGTTATYMGNERVPYLNEIYLHFLHISPPRLNVNVEAELANIYNVSFTNNVSVDITVVYQVNAVQQTVTHSWANQSVNNNAYAALGTVTHSLTNGNSGDDVGIVSIRGEVFVDGNLADLVLIDATGTEFTTNPAVATVDDINTDYAMLFQVQDPRQNLRNETTDENWLFESEGPTAAPPASVIPDTGAQNVTIAGIQTDPSAVAAADGDQESVTDPVDPVGRNGMSTAYIRNGPMESLWELGAIHRGKKWQTLNLHTYNAGTTGFSATYTDGDAGMLEFVKLRDRTVHNGGFTINSVYEMAWTAILTNVGIGGTYADPTTGTTNPTVGTLVTDIIAETAGGSDWTNRGALASVTTMSDIDSIAETDREKEEIIGKIAHLLSTRPNFFTVIAVSQSLRDLGEADATLVASLRTQYGTDDIVEYDSGPPAQYARVLSEYAIMAVVYRDALTDEVRIVHTEELY